MPAAAFQHASGPKPIAYDKATTRAASRSKPIKANHPSNTMPPAASQHDSGSKHCPWQGKCSCCILPHTNSRQKHASSAMPTARCISTCQRIKTLPMARQVLMLHPAASQYKIKAPIQSDGMPPAASPYTSGP
jgi:hypothetical protein